MHGGWAVLGACLAVLIVSCGCKKAETPPAGGAAAAAEPAVEPAAEPAAAAEAETPAVAEAELLARLETSMGAIVLRLEEARAPNTVANFVHLASSGFYDGVIFHRVVRGFVIQGGCPEGSGRGGPGWRIADEFHPQLRHLRVGVLSMANSGPNTGGSQFFITLAPTPHLDRRHAVFGQVVDGFDVLEAIGALGVGANDRPLQPPTIERIVLTRDGAELTGVQPKPETLQGPARP
ncbi:MAG: peptidylprolyl isomerase [Candidatus Brocadiaceae bacterium]|nr:peptidylprolyl isomerase [Candidatus Brocadiaceae bacterium]